METWPKVSIVILNWNYYEDTIACIYSLRKVDYPNIEIIVVDNGSTNESVEILRSTFPRITLLMSNENVGFAAGSNIGIKYALDKGTNYVLLLNNDTEVDKNFLKPLVKVAEKDEDIGIVTGKIYYYDEPKKLYSAATFLNRMRGGFRNISAGMIDHGSFDIPCYVSFISGCLMLIKRKVFEKYGLLPEEYFFGGEDLEFSLRVSKMFKLYYCPDARIWHKVGASHQKFAPKYIYNSYFSKLLFMKRNLIKPVWLVWYFVFWIYAKTWLKPKLAKMARLHGSNDFDEIRTPLALNAALLDGWKKDKITRRDLEQWD